MNIIKINNCKCKKYESNVFDTNVIKDFYLFLFLNYNNILFLYMFIKIKTYEQFHF